MTKGYLRTIFTVVAFAFLARSPAAWAGSGALFFSSASNFRDAVRSLYQQGTDVCGGDCEPELSGPLANLGGSLPSLDSAIAGGNPQSIRDAITNTASALLPVCTALRVDCPLTPVGPINFEKPDPSVNIDCLDRCDWQESSCEASATGSHDSCVNNINEFVFCRLQTPFCDWRSAPFDSGTYGNCRATAFYRQFLQECRCPVPPGQGERQGGCPQFFTQPVGQVGTGACEVPDGLGCARCCDAKCVGADPRLSCRGGNREECDVCEWQRRTVLAGNSMRTSICEESYFRRLDRCDYIYNQCVRSCH